MSGEEGGYDPDNLQYDDDEENEERKAWNASKEQVVCLIDCHSSMFEIIEGDEETQPSIYFKETISLVETFLRDRIKTSPNDEIAVLFYGTRKASGDEGGSIPGVHVLLPLDCPDAAAIQRVRNCSVEDFDLTVGRGDDVDTTLKLRDALWKTQEIFIERKVKTADKRILLFTNQDSPTGGSDSMQKLEQWVGQLAEAHVTLTLLPLVSAFRPFPLTPFWRAVTVPLAHREDGTAGDGAAGAAPSVMKETVDEVALAAGWAYKFRCLKGDLSTRMRRKRTTYRLRWRIAGDLEISVQLFNMVSKAVKPPPSKLHKETNAPLKVETSYICADTGALVAPIELKAFNMPGSSHTDFFPTVVMKVEEVAALKQVKPAGLVLLGFKPLDCLREHHQVKHSHFVYPNDGDLKGSSTVFRALYAEMHKDEKMAVCRFVGSKATAPCLAALIAQAESEDAYGVQVDPPGFQLIMLPFADDIRVPETSATVVGEGALPQANDDQVAAAEALIKQLGSIQSDQLSNLDQWPILNPDLKRHFAVIEALALDEPVPPMIDAEYDGTLPDPEWDTLAADQLLGFGKAVFGAAYTGQAGEVAGKGKKRKAEEVAPVVKDEYARHDWRALGAAGAGGLEKMTIQNLKIYLEYNNLKKTGNKPDIITRIKDHLAGA